MGAVTLNMLQTSKKWEECTATCLINCDWGRATGEKFFESCQKRLVTLFFERWRLQEVRCSFSMSSYVVHVLLDFLYFCQKCGCQWSRFQGSESSAILSCIFTASSCEIS